MSQFHPLQIDPHTEEPCVRLPAPHRNFIITPPRPSDKADITRALNDPKVYEFLAGPPYPYLEEHAEWWLDFVSTTALIGELRESEASGELKVVGGCPVRILREVTEDGRELFFGDVGLSRYGWPEVEPDKRRTLVEENEAKPIGDPTIVWEIGDYIVPSHQGKGIMTTAIRTLIHEWAIPRMGVKRICTTAFLGNKASVRVFEKNGFVVTGEAYDCVEARGKKYSLQLLEWKLDGLQAQA